MGKDFEGKQGNSNNNKLINKGSRKGGNSRRNNGNNKNKTNNGGGSQNEKWQGLFKHATEAGDDENINSDEYCTICTEKLEHIGIYECNHVVCHTCCFRQLKLLDKKSCIICRHEYSGEKLPIITGKIHTLNYNEIKHFYATSHGLNFETKEDKEIVVKLLEYNCKVCGYCFDSFHKLSLHLTNEHQKYYCLICSNFKKVFKCELPIYDSMNELRKHKNRGELGFKGHPKCSFCENKYFYSEDELKIHLREKHEKCHICEKQQIVKYFKDYNHLFEHFKTDHYVCTMQSCLDTKFVVFADEILLKAHMKEAHCINLNLRSNLLTFKLPNAKDQHDTEDSDVDSREIKRLRFEERARHYLDYNQDDFNRFMQLNKDFKSYKISAGELIGYYQSLFIEQDNHELSLLLQEFIELIPNNKSRSNLNKEYSEFFKDLKYNELFPVLGGEPSIIEKNAIWLNKGKKKYQSSSSSLNEKFPTLCQAYGTVVNLKPATNTKIWSNAASTSTSPSHSSVSLGTHSSSTLSLKQTSNKMSNLTLSDSSASWASPGTSSPPSKKSSRLGINENDDFPELPSISGTPKIKVNRKVRYTSLPSKKNLQLGSNTYASNSGYKKMTFKIVRPTQGIKVTNLSNDDSTSSSSSSSLSRLNMQDNDIISNGENPYANSNSGQQKKPQNKKKNKKQLLIHYGI